MTIYWFHPSEITNTDAKLSIFAVEWDIVKVRLRRMELTVLILWELLRYSAGHNHCLVLNHEVMAQVAICVGVVRVMAIQSFYRWSSWPCVIREVYCICNELEHLRVDQQHLWLFFALPVQCVSLLWSCLHTRPTFFDLGLLNFSLQIIDYWAEVWLTVVGWLDVVFFDDGIVRDVMVKTWYFGLRQLVKSG